MEQDASPAASCCSLHNLNYSSQSMHLLDQCIKLVYSYLPSQQGEVVVPVMMATQGPHYQHGSLVS